MTQVFVFRLQNLFTSLPVLDFKLFWIKSCWERTFFVFLCGRARYIFQDKEKPIREKVPLLVWFLLNAINIYSGHPCVDLDLEVNLHFIFDSEEGFHTFKAKILTLIAILFYLFEKERNACMAKNYCFAVWL